MESVISEEGADCEIEVETGILARGSDRLVACLVFFDRVGLAESLEMELRAGKVNEEAALAVWPSIDLDLAGTSRAACWSLDAVAARVVERGGKVCTADGGDPACETVRGETGLSEASLTGPNLASTGAFCHPAEITAKGGDFLFMTKLASLSTGTGSTGSSGFCRFPALFVPETDFLRPNSLAKRPVDELGTIFRALFAAAPVFGAAVGEAWLFGLALCSTAGIGGGLSGAAFWGAVAVESWEPERRRRLGLRKTVLPMVDLSRCELLAPVDAAAGGYGDRGCVLFRLRSVTEKDGASNGLCSAAETVEGRTVDGGAAEAGLERVDEDERGGGGGCRVLVSGTGDRRGDTEAEEPASPSNLSY